MLQIIAALRKIAVDIRDKNGQAVTDIIAFIMLISGFAPTPTPNPTPPIGLNAFKQEGVRAQNVDAVASEINEFCDKWEPHGEGLHANGEFLKALWQLALKLMPLLISGL